ncbi:MAG TPA: hypothetical protein VL092_00570 [Chitinophagaceae bacterium]|nr:hypothetical protein [Chitinophagaceae bacterium]
MQYYIESIIYLIVYLMPVLFGLRRYAVLDKASRFFLLYAISSFIGELIAFFAALKFNNNFPVYNVASVINICLICFYFSECIERLKRNNMALRLTVINIVVWIISVFFIHSFFSINTTFLAYQGVLTIALAVYAMEHLVAQKSHALFHLRSSPHFWFDSLLLVYWCFTIMQWVVYRYFTYKTGGFIYINLSLTIINILINVALAAVFYAYPKLKQPDDI